MAGPASWTRGAVGGVAARQPVQVLRLGRQQAELPAWCAVPQVIAAASLFLAGKVNSEPKPHQQLANELLKAW